MEYKSKEKCDKCNRKFVYTGVYKENPKDKGKKSKYIIENGKKVFLVNYCAQGLCRRDLERTRAVEKAKWFQNK
jgi:hypothetical protein